MSSWRVLVADAIGEAGLELLRRAPSVSVAVDDGRPLEEAARDRHALIVRSRARVTAAVIAAARELRYVVRAGTGVDNIDLDAATERGVVVMNTPGANTVAVAEHTFALMLGLARMVPRADREVKAGSFRRDQLWGVELQGKTLGLVGLGRIGSEVATRARAFGMRVLAYDPLLATGSGVPLVPLVELLESSDFVSLHAPLQADTRHLIDAAALARMLPRACLINCGRGGLVDEQALLAALASGGLRGAALDVFEGEPQPLRALVEREDVIATPHIAAQTPEAGARVGLLAAELVVAALEGRGPRHVVNPRALELAPSPDGR